MFTTSTIIVDRELIAMITKNILGDKSENIFVLISEIQPNRLDLIGSEIEKDKKNEKLNEFCVLPNSIDNRSVENHTCLIGCEYG